MPNQNNSDQKNSQNLGSNIPFSPQSDLPPLPPEFQNLTTPTMEQSSPKPDSGSATPPVPEFSNITANPKKKFGTGKIIATILGVLVLVGGVAIATYTVGQKQIFQQKAATGSCSGSCSTNGNCPEGTKGDGTGKNGGNGCDVGQYCCIGGTSPSSAPGSNTCDNSASTASVCRGKSFGYVADSNWNGTASCQSGFDPKSCVNGIELVCENTSGTLCAANCKCKSGGGGGGTNPSPTPKSGWGIGEACKNNPSTTGDHCIIIRCPNGCVDGCSENDPGATFQSGSCDTLAGQVTSICGQVDLVNSAGVYCQSDGTFTDAQINCPQPKCAITNNPTNPPTSSPAAPYCAVITTYDADWNLIEASSRSTLTAGTDINFCVSGTAPSGTFDKAKFTINGTVQDETTTKRPSSSDYCQSYTIPDDITSFTVSAQIHHSTLGWF